MPEPILPLTPAPASVKIRARHRTKISQATSGRIISRSYGGQYFEMTLVYPTMTAEQFAPINAFLAAQKGRNEIFYVLVPDNMSGSKGTKVGNFAVFDNDWKLHMITGINPVAVTPPAREPGGSMSTNGLYMRCSMTSDVHEIDINQRGLFRYELDLVERL